MNMLLKKSFALRSRALPMAQKTSEEQFWEEEPFTFEGYRGTKIIWPADRPFAMLADGGQSGVSFYRMSPRMTPDILLRQTIQLCLSSGPIHTLNLGHLHLIFIRGHPIFAVFAYYRKATVVRDFFTNIRVFDVPDNFGFYPTATRQG